MNKRLKSIGRMLVWAVAILTVALLFSCSGNGCGCGSEENAPNAAEAGVYVCVDGDAEYTVTIENGNRFTYDIKGSHQSGSYTLDGENLTLAADGVTLSGKLANNAIRLTYDGAELCFYKQIDFTVTFESNGGSAVDPIVTRNGKQAVKPADPVKEGYLFVAWYTDAACKTVFDFETDVVTGNITLYARWVEKTESIDEYVVSFDLGYAEAPAIASKRTVGGKLYDAPEPAREGYVFKGWWISMYDDGEKLSYRYAENTEFVDDTTLYALWQSTAQSTKLPAPTADIQNNLIVWDGILNADKYAVEVSGPEGFEPIAEEIQATSRAVNFADAPAGDYIIKVTAIAANAVNNSDTTVRYYRNKGLKKVRAFAVQDGVLTFAEAEHAEKYFITVDCGDKRHRHTDWDNGKSTTYVFADCAMQPGGIHFTVKAAAAGYAPSEARFTYGADLFTVQNLAFDESTQTLTWDKAEGVTDYRVTVGCADETHDHDVSVHIGPKNVFCVKEYASCGARTVIRVVPEVKGYQAAEAAEYAFDKTALATPKGIRIVGNTLYWSEVPGAASYTVSINGAEVSTQGAVTQLDLTNAAFDWTGDDFVLRIRANGAENSPWSDDTDIRYYAMYTTLRYEHGTVSWRHVVGAQSYDVKVNDGEPIAVTSGENFAAVTLDKAGENTVSVRFNQDGKSSEWATTSVFAYTLTFDANGGTVDVAALYKATGDRMDLPVATKQGYDFALWYNKKAGPDGNGAAYVEEYFGESADVTLYAYYEAKRYEVTLFYDDGRGADGTEKQEVRFNDPFRLPVPASTSEEKTFGGWFSEPNGKGIRFTDETGASLLGWPRPESAAAHAFWRDLVLQYTPTVFEGQEVYEVTKGSRLYTQTEIVIPETYMGKPVTIGPNAFYGCTSVEKIIIPDTIKQISAVTPFAGCTKLQGIEIVHVENNTDIRYWAHGGVLYDSGTIDSGRMSSELIFAPLNLSGSYAIPEDKGVTAVNAGVFAGVERLTEVVIPASVTRVGSQAFKGCVSLASVRFSSPAGGGEAQPLVISDWAFEGCTALKTVTLPARLQDISLTRCVINDYTYDEYEYSPDLDPYFITDIRTSYGTAAVADAFKGCTSLAEINVEAGNEKYVSHDGVLYGKTELLYCPSGRTRAVDIGGYGFAKIADGAFYGSRAVFRTEIPSFVTEIGELAFYKSNVSQLTFAGGLGGSLTIGKCAFAGTALGSITFEAGSNVTEIGEMAFYDCKGLVKLALSKEIRSVGYRAFYRCSELTDVTFADNSAAGASLTFAEEVFNNCTKLESIALPKHAKNLPGFVNCPALKKVVIATDSAYLTMDESGAIFGGDKTALYYFPVQVREYAIPESVVEIGEGVFRENKTLAKITIGKNVEKIGRNAFYNCTALTDVIWQEGGDKDLSVGAYAFYNCAGIRSLDLPARTVSVGDYAFYKAGESASLTFGENSRLTSIGRAAFAYAGAASVRIPKYVTSISAEAFAYSPVTEVSFEDDSCLTEIGYRAFYASRLASITVPKSVTVIAPEAFYNNAQLATLAFQAGGTADLTIGAVDTAHKEDGYYVYGQTFANCPLLAEVILPGRTTELGYAAFAGCSALKTVRFAAEGETSRLKFIPVSAFARSGLTSITIPKSVANHEVIPLHPSGMRVYHAAAVSAGAFSDCYALTEAVFEAGNNNPVSVESGAFSGCLLLKRVVLPAAIAAYTDETGAQVDSFNTAIFTGCDVLQTIEVDPANQTYKSYEGIVYNADYTQVILCPPGIQTARIHDNVKTLSSGIFSACKNLTQLSIPGTLANLANALKAPGRVIDIRVDNMPDVVKLPNGVLCSADEGGNPVAILYVPDALTGTFEIPKTVTRIAELAFQESKLTSVTFEDAADAGLADLYIDESAFLLAEIESIALPARLKSMGNNAFISCANLSSVTFDEHCRLSSIGNAAFYNCGSLARIELPAQLKELPDGAENFGLFGKCDNLTSVTFADGSALEKIGAYAFAKSKITAVTIPASVKLVGAHAFDGAALREVAFAPGSVCEMIGAYAFSDCKALTGITIPAAVQYLGEGALKGCALLARVSFEQTSALRSIGNAAFSGCAALASFAIPAAVGVIGDEAFSGCAALTYIAIPYNVVSLGGATFSGCRALRQIDNIENVTSFGESCFAGTAIASVKLSDKLTELPASAFERCTSLTAVEIPDSVTAIGENAFNGCVSLASVKLPSNAQFVELADHLFSGCRKLTQITIPGTVKTIGRYALSSTAVTEIAVPDSVITIMSGAFSGCMQLVTVTGLKFVIDIHSSTDNSPFDGCVKLSEIELPITAAYTTISAGLFSGCTALARIEIPSNVQKIESYAFSGCKALASVTFNEGLTDIGGYAFYNCAKLTSVRFPDSLRSIGKAAFGACYGLQTVQFNEGLASVGHTAFSGCTQLAALELPESLIELGSYAFRNCLALRQDVRIPAGLTTIGYNPFVGSGVTGFAADGSGENLFVEDGALAAKTEDGVMIIAFPAGIEGTYTVPDNRLVGPRAFEGSHLTEVVLSPTVRLVYDYDGFSSTDDRYKGYNFNDSAIERLVILGGDGQYVRVCAFGFGGMNLTDGVYFKGGEAEWNAFLEYNVGRDGNRAFLEIEPFYYSQNYAPGAWRYVGDEIKFWQESDLQEVTYTFRLNNGAADAQVKAVFLTSDKLPTAARADYIFAGWYDNSACTGRYVTFPYFTGNDATLYAKWIRELDCDGKTTDTAYRVTLDAAYEKAITQKDTWLAIAVMEETRLRITVQSDSDIMYTLYDFDNKPLENTTGSFTVVKNYAADTYYLHINVYSGSYTGTVRVEKLPFTPGSTQSRAIEVSPSEGYTGALDAGEYWFKFDLADTGMFDVYAEGARLSYTLCDKDGAAVHSGSLPVRSLEVEEGVHYLKVTPSGAATDFTLHINPVGGSSMASAFEAELGQTYTVQTSSSYWFKFTPSYSARVTITTDSYLAGSTLYGYVYNGNGVLVKEQYGYVTAFTLNTVFTEGNTYYVRIRPLTGAALDVTFAAEQIQTPEGATQDTAIRVDLTQEFSRRLYADLAPYWLTFTVTDATDVEIFFTDMGLDDFLYVLFDVDHNVVANGTLYWDPNKDVLTATHGLAAGTYYLLVNLHGNSDDDFTVNVRVV